MRLMKESELSATHCRRDWHRKCNRQSHKSRQWRTKMEKVSSTSNLETATKMYRKQYCRPVLNVTLLVLQTPAFFTEGGHSLVGEDIFRNALKKTLRPLKRGNIVEETFPERPFAHMQHLLRERVLLPEKQKRVSELLQKQFFRKKCGLCAECGNGETLLREHFT